MADTHTHQSSAELEREVAAQREQIDRRISDIQDRLSPGQLVDEVLRYGKRGGADFASGLGNAVVANPVPAVLLGVSLAWLMAGPKEPAKEAIRTPSYPYARVSGNGLRRTGHAIDEAGEWYSHFIDDAGTQYRARADAAGRRTGHFVDETGKKFGGFIDEAGNRVEAFRDEAGNMLEDAANWASHGFRDASDAAGRTAGSLADGATRLGSTARARSDEMSHAVLDLLHAQPLVAGALAFAAGAALGATLPHTEQEDRLFGSEADQLKREAGHRAEDLYEAGKARAADVYEGVAESAGAAYDKAKATLSEEQGNGEARHH